MKCSDCQHWKTKSCHSNTSGKDIKAAEKFSCFVLKKENKSLGESHQNKSEDGARVNDSKKEYTCNEIALWDRELDADIQYFENYICDEESLARKEMYGTPSEVIERVLEEERKKGKHMIPPFSWTFASMLVDDLLKNMKELRDVVMHYSFRAHFFNLSVIVITSNGRFFLNTNILSDEERKRFFKCSIETWPVDFFRGGHYYTGHPKYQYPTVKSMAFIEEMLNKYDRQSLLSSEFVVDDGVTDLLINMIDNEKRADK